MEYKSVRSDCSRLLWSSYKQADSGESGAPAGEAGNAGGAGVSTGTLGTDGTGLRRLETPLLLFESALCLRFGFCTEPALTPLLSDLAVFLRGLYL